MKDPSNTPSREDLRRQIIGLGKGSFRKNYYTALRKSYAEQERFRAVIDRLPDYILILDRDYWILDANSQAEQALAVRTPQGYQRLDQALPGVYQELVVEKKAYSLWEDQREVILEEIPLDDQIYFTLIFRDIETRIKNEKQLEQLVEARMAELKEAHRQLAFNEKMVALGEMVAGVAHEVNTPIGIGVTAASNIKEITDELLKAMAENRLTRSRFETLTGDLNETAELVLNNLFRAAELVSSFKRVAVDQQFQEWRVVDFSSYLKDIVRSLHPKWKEHQLNYQGPEQLYFYTMPGVWSQILTNFITNSISHGFTPGRGGEINIHFEIQGDTFCLLYEDNGIGLQGVHPDKIFEPFFTTKKNQGGSGLGLPIVYRLVTENLGGQIIVEERDPGLAFRLKIPYQLSNNQPKN